MTEAISVEISSSRSRAAEIIFGNGASAGFLSK
jgi:hypothetical protein